MSAENAHPKVTVTSLRLSSSNTDFICSESTQAMPKFAVESVSGADSTYLFAQEMICVLSRHLQLNLKNHRAHNVGHYCQRSLAMITNTKFYPFQTSSFSQCLCYLASVYRVFCLNELTIIRSPALSPGLSEIVAAAWILLPTKTAAANNHLYITGPARYGPANRRL